MWIKCPHCHLNHFAAGAVPGALGACSECGGGYRVPAQVERAPPPAAPTFSAWIRCPHCRQAHYVMNLSPGGVGACPGCSGPFRAPLQAPPQQPPPQRLNVQTGADQPSAPGVPFVTSRPAPEDLQAPPVEAVEGIEEIEEIEETPSAVKPVLVPLTRDDAFADESRPPRPLGRKRKRRVAKRYIAPTSGPQTFSVVELIPIDTRIQAMIANVIGLILSVAALVHYLDDGTEGAFWGYLVPALVFHVWGCAALARSKGYPAGFAAFGLLGIFGVGLLQFLPDQA